MCPGKRVVLAGDSAGGHLALDLLLRGDGGGGPTCAAVLAVCPWFDLTHTSAAHTLNAGRDSVHLNLAEHGASTYIAPKSGLAARRAASPAFSDKLGALPARSLFVIVGERECLRDDAETAAQTALAAGAPADAIAIHTVDDSVWGAHCALLLPLAETCSPAVRRAFDAMASFVAEDALARR